MSEGFKKFTSREDDGTFKQNVITGIDNFIENASKNANEPFMRSFSMRHEFPIECYAFLNQPDSFNNQVLNIAIDNSRFPYFAANKTISISEILVLAESSENPLVSQGIILLPPNIVATIVSGVDPSSKVNSQPMSAITAPDIPQVAFDYSSAINPGNFMIVNPKSNNYQLSNDSIKDLILIVYYHL